MQLELTVKDILDFLRMKDLNFVYLGDIEKAVCGISPVADYKKSTITWIKSRQKYLSLRDKIDIDLIDIVIADSETQDIANFRNVFIYDNPKYLFSVIAAKYFQQDDLIEKIGRNTVVEITAQIGDNVCIGTNCYIGGNVKIGDGTRIYHNVVINNNVVIGKNCCLESGAVIGQTGYGYSESKNFEHIRVPHLGRVIIEDNVDIGANTCIDRGTIGDTIIGYGSKIDNLCHIAHNVKIGKNVMIVAGTVIGGSAVLEDNVYLAPGVIVRNQITVEEGSLIGMGGVAVKNTRKGCVYSGVPAKVMRERGNENL